MDVCKQSHFVFWCTAVFLSVIYFLFFGFIFVRFYGGDNFIPPISLSLNIYFLLWLVLLMGGYSFFCFSKKNISQKELKIGVVFSFLWAVFLLAYPISASLDVHNYFFSSRIFVEYQQNPYIRSFNHFSDDKYFLDTIEQWRGKSSPYGPLFTLISIIIYKFSGGLLSNFVVITKLFSLLCFGVSAYLIFKISQYLLPQRKNWNTLVFLWNPVILFEAVNNGHNDIILLFVLLLMLFFYLREFWGLMIFACVLGILLKYIPLLLLPLVLVAVWKKGQTNFFWLKNFLINATLIIVAYFPFWEGSINIFKGLIAQGGRKEMLFYYSIAPFINNIIGVGSGEVLYVIFAVFYLAILYFFIVGKSDFVKSLWYILMGYLVLVCYWFEPWYLIWVIPFTIFLNHKKNVDLIVLLTMWGAFSYFVPAGLLGSVLAVIYLWAKYVN